MIFLALEVLLYRPTDTERQTEDRRGPTPSTQPPSQELCPPLLYCCFFFFFFMFRVDVAESLHQACSIVRSQDGHHAGSQDVFAKVPNSSFSLHCNAYDIYL
jgi:hypothetical protein